MVEVVGARHDVDGDLDIHVSFDFLRAIGGNKRLRWFGDDRVAVVVEPINKRRQLARAVFLEDSRVVIGAVEIAMPLEERTGFGIVDVPSQRAARRVDIRAVDEERDTLVRAENAAHESLGFQDVFRQVRKAGRGLFDRHASRSPDLRHVVHLGFPLRKCDDANIASVLVADVICRL
jgi:hypothetical protein